MPKRRVRFDQESDVSSSKTQRTNEYKPNLEVKDDEDDVQASGSRLSTNNDHTIDSDEEEETQRKSEEFEKLNEEDIEGAEDGDVGDEFSINEPAAKITPFNLKEEMEEGDFDVDGHYHFKKDKDIRDNWLDNIDWMKVSGKSGRDDQDDKWDDESDDDDPGASTFEEIKIIESMVKLLRKGETVGAAIRRLGSSNKKSKKKNWKKSNVYDLEADEEEENDGSEATEDERKASFTELTELADQMASAGHYDIYTDTYEKLHYKLNSLNVSKQAASIFPDDDVSDDDALDMFGDDLDAKQSKDNDKKDEGEKTGESTSNSNSDDETVRWEYKWNDKDPTVYGPFTSDQMAEWKGKGFFQDSLVVRKIEKSSKDSIFYSARRIDFDLYT